MPYEIAWEKDGAYTRFFGVVSGSELRNNSKSILADPRGAGIKYSIADFTDIESHEIGATDVLFTAATDSALANAPLIVVYSKGLAQDLALIDLHHHSPLMQKRAMKVFDNLAEARLWIESAIG